MEERVGPRSNPERPLKVVAILVAVLLAIGWGAYFLLRSTPPPPPPSASAPPPPPPPAATHYAVAASAEPLPKLAESDATVLDTLKKLLDPAAVAKLVVPESLIRNFVATVDNLTRDHLAMRVSPVHAASGILKTTGQDDTLAIAAANDARYAPYVDAFDATDPAAVVAAYVRMYPLFQQAYVELGFPNGYFNDRLVQVIDHLLEAPDLKAPVKLVSPRVLFLYADPDLEARSSGQKILMRMGAANEARVKAKLRAYRKELEAQTPPK
jgi:Protein of unknown function (DUF3014)